MPSWAYMLRCADGSYYVGCTTDLDTRLGQHQGGEQPGYTASRRPVEMVWAEEFGHIDEAITAERRIKGWSRAKKEALIAGDWDRITRLGSRAKPGTATPAVAHKVIHPTRHTEEDGGAGRLKAHVSGLSEIIQHSGEAADRQHATLVALGSSVS